jgi:site-specific DNA-methyltransferase (adenine-specific)
MITEECLRCGDCLEVLKDLQSDSMDMVLCDPPYRMTKRGKSCRPNYMPASMGENFFQGEIPKVEDWMSEAYRVLKQGHFYVFTNTKQLQDNLNAASRTGFDLHNILSMIKDTKMPNRWYLKYTELILMFRKGRAVPISDMTSRDYFQCEMPTQKNGKLHPTQKPLSVIEKLVSNSAAENQWVADFFMGSGTTGVACRNLNRNFIGIEKDPKYFEIAKKRILESV